ncbi:MAG TPA: cytochrome c biogenesis protein CcsA [Aggregatilineales bacterium]|nr:cytochrome c biogenesis protein CcsA [Anaerolineales bacterium]HRE47848.1 cytochrome c biogenesis protein CcsA [Aggregatilineales bacterium]
MAVLGQATSTLYTPPTSARPTQYPLWRTRLLWGLTAALGVGIFAMLYMVFFYAGTEINQGHVQRIFYIHVSAYAGGAVVFLITVIAGALYLYTRKAKWDRLALSSVEVGLPLMIVTLVTGSVWARPIWNVWWTADPRLNAMGVMVLLYLAYLVLRGAMDDPDRRARFAAVYGMLAFISVVYVYLIPRIRTDTLHPEVTTGGVQNPMASGGFQFQGDNLMGTTVSVAMIWFCTFAVVLLWHRVRLQNRIEALREREAALMDD